MCAIQWVRLLFILSSMTRVSQAAMRPYAPAVTEEVSDKSIHAYPWNFKL